jgi:hypothetical protein
LNLAPQIIVRFMFCVWQFCFRRASLSRFIDRFPSNQDQTPCFDFVCQLSPICNSPVDTPMIISSFIFALNTCYQHDKLFTRRQIQIVLILFQSHCIYNIHFYIVLNRYRNHMHHCHHHYQHLHRNESMLLQLKVGLAI